MKPMQGINRSKHEHLVDALLQLEHLVSGVEDSTGTPDLQATSAALRAKRLELEKSHQVYLDMLDNLAFHIAAYKGLFAEIKVYFVGNSLKKLKK